MEKTNKFINPFIISLLFSISLFLWSIDFYFFQLRFLYLILIIPIVFQILNNFKKEKSKIILSTIFLIPFLIVLFLNLDLLNIKTIFSILIFFFTFIIIIFYGHILKNIDFLIFFLFIFFFLSLIISGKILIPDPTNIYKDSFDQWCDRCGGIPIKFFSGINEVNSYNFVTEFVYGPELATKAPQGYVNITKGINTFKIGIKEFIFKENSHLSIIASGIILYLISRFYETKSVYLKFIIIFFIFIFYNKSSTTLFLSILISFFTVYLFNFNKFSKKKLKLYLVVIGLVIVNLLYDNTCKKKLDFVFNKINNLSKITTIKFLKNDTPKYKINNDEEIANNGHNINSASAAILLKSYEITKKSLTDKPFGWGINNYHLAHNYYLKELLIFKSYENYIHLVNLNESDASSTLFKLLVEIGIFSILILFFLIKYLVNSNVPIDEKLFFFTIFISSLIRGVGYFNSGFVIILIFIILRDRFK